MKTLLFLSLTLTVTLGVPVPEWEPIDDVLPLADVLPEQGHVIQEEGIRPGAGLEKGQGPAEVKAAPLDPVVPEEPAEQQGPVALDTGAQDEQPAVEQPVEQPVVQEEVVKEEDQRKSPDEQGLESDLLPEVEPAVEEQMIPKDEPGVGLESVEEEEEDATVQEMHPVLGRLTGVEEPTMELEPEEEDPGMHMPGYLTEEEDEMVEQPEMELEPLPEEEPAMPEAELMDPRMRVVEEPTMELEPQAEEELTSQDEPGTEGEPEEEEELMGEEGPVAVGETVVDVEQSPEQETDPEEPVPLARSGFAQGPLMDGMTVKQAMMEEEPDMWVGPDVVGAGPERGMEEEPGMWVGSGAVRAGPAEEEANMWTGGDEESAAMAGDMDTDDRMLVRMETHGDEETGVYADNFYRARSMDEEFLNEVATERRSCGGVVIDGRCYRFFRGPKKAPEAEFFCQNNFPNGHLASVTNSYIHQQMMSLMAQNGGYTRTWIGGLRYLDTGRFIWLDGAHWDYADWLYGEPNNTAGVENCVELLRDSKFNDMPCWDLRAYICSYPV